LRAPSTGTVSEHYKKNSAIKAIEASLLKDNIKLKRTKLVVVMMYILLNNTRGSM